MRNCAAPPKVVMNHGYFYLKPTSLWRISLNGQIDIHNIQPCRCLRNSPAVSTFFESYLFDLIHFNVDGEVTFTAKS